MPAPGRPSGRWIPAVLAFAAFLALNLATAAPTVVEGDGAELQTVALRGGIPHAPGYPAWTMLGQVLTRLLPGEPAFRVTVMNAVFGAAAVAAAAYLVTGLGAPAAAIAAALLVGLGVTVRWSSIYPEVYALAILLYLIALHRALRALARPAPGAALLAAALLSLATTAHFAFAPAAAVLGVALIAASGRNGRGWLRTSAAVAAGALAGFLPYLYVLWADAAGLPMNYLRTVVDAHGGTFGLVPEAFDQPLERIGWLLFGSEARPFHYYARPRMFAENGIATLLRQALFESGPLALGLAALGGVWLARRRPGACAVVVAAAAASLLWSAALANARLSQTFQLPLTLAVGIFAALGGMVAAARVAPAGPARSALAVGLALAAALVPHAIRVRAADVPIAGMRYVPEGGPAVTGLLPSFRGYREPRETGERVLAALPPRALAIARWRDLTTLWYLREVEGLRRDVELDPIYRGHERRYARWQIDPEFRGRPIVLIDWSPEIAHHLGALDSVRVTPRLVLYTLREPMRGLPPP